MLGGTAMGLATTPSFEFSINAKNEAANFHPESPAGKYLASGRENSISFTDPYSVKDIRGGFGRSTAEYLAVVTPELLKKKASVYDILRQYRDFYAGQNIRPSGIDLVFQYMGGVTLVDQQLHLFQNFDWNFSNLDFYLIYSGIKVPTHDHLATLNLSELNELPPLSALVSNLYVENNETEFLYQLNQWCELLKRHNLTHENSLEIRRLLESTGIIKLVKPCGALGADVLIVFFDRADKKQVLQLLNEKKHRVVASSGDLTSGLVSQLRPYWSQNVG